MELTRRRHFVITSADVRFLCYSVQSDFLQFFSKILPEGSPLLTCAGDQGVGCSLWVHGLIYIWHFFMEYAILSYILCIYIYLIINRVCYKDVPMYSGLSRGCHEIWEALVLRTSNMASTLVQSQMSTCPRWIKLICTIIICSSIGRVSSACHLSNKANIAFQTRGRWFPWPLFRINTWSNITWCHLQHCYDWDINRSLCSQHISLSCVSYGMPIVRIWEKSDGV